MSIAGAAWFAKGWGFTDVDKSRRLFLNQYGHGPDDWDTFDNQP